MPGCSGPARTHHPPLRWTTALRGLLSAREMFSIALPALAQSSPKSSPDGHVVRFCAPQGKEPKEQCPALPRAVLPSRRAVAREEVTAQAATTPELPSFLPFLTSGLLKLSESEAILSNPKRECTSLHRMGEHQCPPLAGPVGPRGLGTRWRPRLRTQSTFLYVFHRRQVH